MPSGGVMDESSSVDNPQLHPRGDKRRWGRQPHTDYGFTVAAHAYGAKTIRRAVLGRVNSIEHGSFMNDEDMALDEEAQHLVRPDHNRGKEPVPAGFPAAGRRKGISDRSYYASDRWQGLQGRRLRSPWARHWRAYARRKRERVRLHGRDRMPPMYAKSRGRYYAQTILKPSKRILGSVTARKFAI